MLRKFKEKLIKVLTSYIFYFVSLAIIGSLLCLNNYTTSGIILIIIALFSYPLIELIGLVVFEIRKRRTENKLKNK